MAVHHRSSQSFPSARAVSIVSATTDGDDGATWGAFPPTACNALDIVNNSGADIEYRRDGAGDSIPVPAGSARLVVGITDADQVEIRRVDQDSTAVTVTAEALTA